MGDPSGYIEPVHAAGGVVMHTVGSAEEARRPGIGDARGVAAVLTLGAQAAWLGTRFLMAEEMPIHEDCRRALIAAAETDPQLYANLYEVGVA